MVFKFKSILGHTIHIGTTAFRVRSIRGGMTKRIRKITGDKTIMFTDLHATLKLMLMEDGLEQTKQWLYDNDFSESAIEELLVFEPDTGQIHARGELMDSLAYEFFGVPQRVFPNVTALRGWVKDRVLERDYELKRKFDAKTEKGQENMLDQLTFLFGRSIWKNGLKRQYTTEELDPHSPDEIYVIWEGNKHRVPRAKKGKPRMTDDEIKRRRYDADRGTAHWR